MPTSIPYYVRQLNFNSLNTNTWQNDYTFVDELFRQTDSASTNQADALEHIQNRHIPGVETMPNVTGLENEDPMEAYNLLQQRMFEEQQQAVERERQDTNSRRRMEQLYQMPRSIRSVASPWHTISENIENLIHPAVSVDITEALQRTYIAPALEPIKPPLRTYSQVKKLLYWAKHPLHSKNADTFRYIIKLVTSLSVKRYGTAYTSEEYIKASRIRVQSWLCKNTKVKFIEDQINPWALIHPSTVYQMRSNNGVLLVGQLTLRDNGAICAHTQEEWLSSDLISVSDRGLISPSAYDQLGYWFCDNCNSHRPFHEENCTNCTIRSSNVEIGKLYNYNDNVRDFIPTLFDIPVKEFEVDGKIIKHRRGRANANNKERKSKLYFGLELEVIPRDGVTQKDALYWLSSVLKNYALLKHDGSLANGGFEIVTAPATLDFHRKKLWNDLFDLKLPVGKTAAQLVKSWSTTCCGLHIHFTRAACADMQLSKMLVFYHEPDNARFLGDIAGRLVGPRSAYCHQKQKKLRGKRSSSTGKMVSTTIDDCQEHHEAITISQRNRGKTVEVRIFRGNVTMHGVMRALDFVAATIEWAAVAGSNVKSGNLHYTKFLEWFDESSNRSRFPDLWRHLISLGYLGTRHRSKNKKVLDELPSELRAA